MEFKTSVFTEKTLVPISLVITICLFTAWLVRMEAKIDLTEKRLDAQKEVLKAVQARQEEYDRSINNLLRDIAQRIATIEGVLLESRRSRARERREE